MAEDLRDPMTGIGGGTGLMELSVSADAIADDVFPRDPAAPDAATSTSTAIVLAGSRRAPESALADERPPSTLRILHNLLRRRYKWLIPLALGCGIIGAYAGYRSKKPVYMSTGTILLKAHLPRILYQTEQSNVMPMFDAFAESQVALLNSDRVLGLALQSREWKALNRPDSAIAVPMLQRELTITRRGSELIQVSLTDEDPLAAKAGTKSVIDAYVKIYGESDAESDTQRSQVLEERRTVWANQLKALNDRIMSIANEFGSDSLEPIYQFKLAELNKLETELRACQTALALAESKDAASKSKPGTDGPLLTPDMVAENDPGMRALLLQRFDVEQRMAELGTRLGSSHNAILQLRNQMAILNDAIRNRVQDAQNALQEGRNASVNVLGTPLTLSQLRLRQRDLQVLYDRAKAETVDLGRKDLEIKNLKAESARVQDSLNQAKARIEALNVESSVSGRIAIISTGDLPSLPYSDKRIERASLGGIGGFGLVFGAFVLLALMDRRIRSVSDFQRGPQRNLPVIGLLPQLSPEATDFEQSKSAAFCVHQLRTLLEVRPACERQVLAITSATAGDGKTSLALALGLSFAGAGSKTLLIDCDVVDGGLTQRMNAIIRRKIGAILIHNGLLTQFQLEKGLQKAKQEDRYIGEALVELGYLKDEDVLTALSLQEKSRVGLPDVLDGNPLTECIMRTGTDNLSILPRGTAEACHMGRLSPKAIRRLVSEARQSFEIVLIDTGSILENLETSVAAAAADEVLVAVSRGQDQKLVDRTIKHLQAIGARLGGLVFNRADALDIDSYEYSGLRHVGLRGIVALDGQSAGESGAHMRLGPLASAMSPVESSTSLEAKGSQSTS